MKTIFMTSAVGAAMLGVVALLVHPSFGVLYSNPGAAFSVGLIGLGVCIEMRKRSAATTAARQSTP